MTPHPLIPLIPLLPMTGRRRSLVFESSEKARRATTEMRDLLPSSQTRQGSGVKPTLKIAAITRLLTPIIIQAIDVRILVSARWAIQIGHGGEQLWYNSIGISITKIRVLQFSSILWRSEFVCFPGFQFGECTISSSTRVDQSWSVPMQTAREIDCSR